VAAVDPGRCLAPLSRTSLRRGGLDSLRAQVRPTGRPATDGDFCHLRRQVGSPLRSLPRSGCPSGGGRHTMPMPRPTIPGSPGRAAAGSWARDDRRGAGIPRSVDLAETQPGSPRHHGRREEGGRGTPEETACGSGVGLLYTVGRCSRVWRARAPGTPRAAQGRSSPSAKRRPAATKRSSAQLARTCRGSTA